MKTRFIHFILAAGLSVLGSQTLSAQDRAEVVDIPFAFHANQRTFPAGEYRLAAKSHMGLFQLSDKSGHSIFVSAPVMKSGRPDPRLMFARYGDDYLLSEIWLSDDTTGYAVSDSVLKKELTRKIGVVSMVAVKLH